MGVATPPPEAAPSGLARLHAAAREARDDAAPFALVAAAIPLLYFATTPGVIYLFAFLFGIALGGDYMIIPLMAAELFGLKVMGRVMGLVITADGLGEAFAPMLAAWLRDRSGSYANGFAALIVLAAIGTVAVALLPRRMQKL